MTASVGSEEHFEMMSRQSVLKKDGLKLTRMSVADDDDAVLNIPLPPPFSLPYHRRRTYGSMSLAGLYDLTDEGPQDMALPCHPSASAFDVPPETLTSDLSTFVNLIKGYLGTGYLAMPVAFMYAGLWFSLASYPIIVIVLVHCLHLLLQSSRELCQRYQVPCLNYEETAHVAFFSSVPLARMCAPFVGIMVRIFLVITQLGFCCAYYQFVVGNVYQFVECNFNGTNLTYLAYSAIVICPVMAVSFLKDLKTITYISVVSGLVQLVSITIILYYCTRDLPVSSYKLLPPIGDAENIPLFYGITFFSFEGIGLVLLLENKMKTPGHFGGSFGILNLGMFFIAALYFSVAFFGYLHYGPTTQGSITLNLPTESALAQAVIICMTLAVLLTFPLQLYVPVQVLLPFAVNATDTDRAVELKEYFTRVVLVFSVFSLSSTIPNIGIFMSFIGAFSSSSLAFIFPPLIHLVTFPPEEKWRGKLVITKASLIIAFGLFVFITGTITSVMRISKVIKDPGSSTALHCDKL